MKRLFSLAVGEMLKVLQKRARETNVKFFYCSATEEHERRGRRWARESLWPFKEEGQTEDSVPLRVSLSGNLLIYPLVLQPNYNPRFTMSLYVAAPYARLKSALRL